MNPKSSSPLRKRVKLTKLFYKNPSDSLKELLMSKFTECSNLILTEKENYQKMMTEKLDNPFTAPKAYWSVLNNFLGKRKTPDIPPLIVKDFVVSDFTTNANLFNNFFASQCSPVVNYSTLLNFSYKTQKRVSDIEIKEDDILLIIKNLNPNKAHGWDNVSIRMIQRCVKSILTPLKLLFESSITADIFPEDWKKRNIIPVQKKESKNCLKNYRPISLLPIFSKIFERLIFNALFNFFVQNQLFTDCQSGFIPGNSCVSQLLSITQEIHKSFDCNPPEDVRGVFLDISKAFDKVWHEGLIFKLKSYGVKGKFIMLLENYLKNRNQRVVLNGINSSWKKNTSRGSTGISVGTTSLPHIYK